MTSHGTSATTVAAFLVFACFAVPASAQANDELNAPEVGETAQDAELQPLKGDKIKLSQLTDKGPVVLVVLRGFPGYQCPLCSRQVSELRRRAEEFVALGTKVVLVYPGTVTSIKEKAEEFLAGKELPEPLLLVIDPGYDFTSLFGLRWHAPRETAYPSTFVLDERRTVKFRKVSRSHGDRAKTEDVLKVLRAMRST